MGPGNMTWWTWALIGWLVLSVPVAVLVGRAIALAQQRQDADDARGLLGDARETGPSVPLPRGEDDEDGRRTPVI
jgi:hypothetical protein